MTASTAPVLRPSDVAELWRCSEAHVRTLTARLA
jgi:hypothetical protein